MVITAVAPTGETQASRGDASAVLEWNATAGAAARAACLSPSNDPLHEARMYAITHIAVHDALNTIDRRYRAVRVHGRAPRRTSVPAAVAAAAHDALVATLADLPTELFPPSLAVPGRHRPRRRRLRGRLGGDPGRHGQDERDRRRPGRRGRDRRARAGDHANDPPLVDTDAAWRPTGEYQFTPGTPFAFAPKWGSVTPFMLRDSTQFASGPPYPLTSRRYAAGLQRGQAVGWWRRR